MKIILAMVLILASSFMKNEEAKIRIFMAGNSTMADKPMFPSHPERGWGQVLHHYFNKQVDSSITQSMAGVREVSEAPAGGMK